MQKVVDFLEKYVQWIALGLGGLFLLFMAYTYIVSDPVTVEVAGQNLEPGEVEEQTLNGPVRLIQDMMPPKGKTPELPPVPDFVAAFQERISGKGVQVADMTNGWPTFPGGVGPDGPRRPDQQGFPITSLPQLAAATLGDVSKGLSRVMVPDAKAADEAQARAAALARGGAVAEQANAPVPMAEREVNWVTVSADIPWDKVVEAFRKSFDVPALQPQQVAQLMQTMFLDVSLERQEQVDGKWGEAQVVPNLANNPRPPFPGPKASDQEIQIFLNAVGQQANAVMKPTFYEVVEGDEWYPPGQEPIRAVADPGAPFDPSAPGARPRNAEERKLLLEYQRSRRGGAGRPAGGDPAYGPAGYTGRPPAGYTGRPPAGYPYPGPGAYGRPGAFGQPGGFAGQQGAQGRFNVMTVGQEAATVWAHDDTAQAGKTYRYRIRYALANPIFRAVAMAPPELVKQFALQAPPSDWSEPVTVQPKQAFFVVQASDRNSQIELFQIKAGGVDRRTLKELKPGDAVADTGWSVVDARKDPVEPSKWYLLLTSPSGQLVRRDPDAERRDPEYQKYMGEASAGGGPLVARP